MTLPETVYQPHQSQALQIYLPGKFGLLRFYGMDINSCINSYINTSERAEITPSICDIERFSRIRTLIHNFQFPEKFRQGKKQLHSVMLCKQMRQGKAQLLTLYIVLSLVFFSFCDEEKCIVYHETLITLINFALIYYS